MAVTDIGEVATGGTTTSGTTLTVTFDVVTQVGDLLTMIVSYDNLSATTPRISSITDAKATWTVQSEAGRNASAAAGIGGSLLTAVVTTAHAVGNTISVILTGSVSAKSADVYCARGVDTGATPTVATPTDGVASNPSISITPLAAGAYVLAAAAGERGLANWNADTDTTDGSWSAGRTSESGGSALAQSSTYSQSKIVTGTSAQTWTTVLDTTTNTDWVAFAIAWPEAGAGSSVTGVGVAALGALTATATGTKKVTGVGISALGALTATASGTKKVTGVGVQALGTLTATASGFRTYYGIAVSTLGGLTGTATGAKTVPGSGVASLGSLTSTASGVVTPPVVTGVGNAALGALSASASGTVTAYGVGAGPLGALTATASGTRFLTGSGASTLGSLAGSAIGARTAVGSVSFSLGTLTATSSGTKDVYGVALGHLGTLTGFASSLPTGDAFGPLGGLVGTATGYRSVVSVAVGPLGTLVGTSVAVRTVNGAASFSSSLTGTATGTRATIGSAFSPAIVLLGTAQGNRLVYGAAAQNLGTLVGTAIVAIEVPQGVSIAARPSLTGSVTSTRAHTATITDRVAVGVSISVTPEG
jgi:hypothetical protein